MWAVTLNILEVDTSPGALVVPWITILRKKHTHVHVMTSERIKDSHCSKLRPASWTASAAVEKASFRRMCTFGVSTEITTTQNKCRTPERRHGQSFRSGPRIPVVCSHVPKQLQYHIPHIFLKLMLAIIISPYMHVYILCIYTYTHSLSLSLYVYVCICMLMCIQTNVYIYIRIYLYVCIYIYTYMYIICTYIYIYISIDMYIGIYRHL